MQFSDERVWEQKRLQGLAAQGQLMAYRHEAFFFAMDTYGEYKHLKELWDNRDAPWNVWE
jgi:glucose-1-phosphate cytidylyltransferase